MMSQLEMLLRLRGASTIQRPLSFGESSSSESALLLHALDQLELLVPLDPNIIFAIHIPICDSQRVDNILQVFVSHKSNSSFAVAPWHEFH